MKRSRVLSLLTLSGALFASHATAEVQIERTFLPYDAAPSSFAIGLPGGVSFCFDPMRCSVSYVWTGGFIDTASVRPGMGKRVDPVKLLGPVVYQETGAVPLRSGDAKHVPTIAFKGYTLGTDTVEFRYTIDGVLVREEIRTAADGAGLTRHFRIADAKNQTWSYVAEGQPATSLAKNADGSFMLNIPFGKAAE